MQTPSRDETLRRFLHAGSALWDTPMRLAGSRSSVPSGAVDAALQPCSHAQRFPMVQSAVHVPRRPVFCLHLVTVPSVAGAMCAECGSVIAATNSPLETRGPVAVKQHHIDSTAAPVVQARTEWDQQTTGIVNQPREVLQHAWIIFEKVYGR